MAKVTKKSPIVAPLEVLQGSGGGAGHSGGQGPFGSAGHRSSGRGSSGHGGHDNRKSPRLVRISDSLTWDGVADATGSIARDGSRLSYSVRGTLIRVERKKKKNRERKKKVLGKTGIFAGDITIETGGEPPVPLSLTLDSPADGTVTNQNTITVSGSVTGEEPLTVTVNGATVALTDDDFSTTVNLSEGSNSIDVVAADGSNQTAEESVTVTLDTVSPQLSLDPSSDLIPESATRSTPS